MKQVWLIDRNGFYKNEYKFIKTEYDKKGNEIPLDSTMTDVPLTVGYIKAQLVNEEWVEGATQDEIDDWKEANKPIIEPDKAEIRLIQIEQAIGVLATQTAKNTLLQNGGMR